MPLHTNCEIYCPICKETMNYIHGYGYKLACCSKKCYLEFDWRLTLSILGKEYYPDPCNKVENND